MKSDSRRTLELFSAKKTSSKNTYYSKNDKFSKITKIGHNAWAIAFAKCSLWVKNSNSNKGVKNDPRSTLDLFCAKNGFKKHVKFEKLTSFRKSPIVVTMHEL